MGALKKLLVVVAGLAAVMQARSAVAELEYTAGGAGSGTVINAAAGETVNVPIYVREFGGTLNISGDGGLFAAGFQVQRTSAPGATNAVITGVLRNISLFDTTNAGSTYSDGSAKLSVDQSGGAIANPAMPTSGLLLIGTVSVQAAALAGSTAYSIGDFDPTTGSSQFITYGGAELDGIVNSATFTVVTVPEPATAMLVAGMAGVFAFGRRTHGAARRA